jgi:hypothetical protein
LHRGWVGPRAGRVQRMDEKSSASTRNWTPAAQTIP